MTKELLKIKIPETWEQKKRKFKKILPKEMAGQILKSEYLDLFEKFKKYGPVMVANTFTSIIKDLKRQGIFIENLEEKDFEKLFRAVNSKKIPKEAISNVLKLISKGTPIDETLKKKRLTEKKLREIIRQIFNKYPELVREKRISALMGEVMKVARGRISGKIVLRILKKELEK